jgi:sulfite reductase alpha subunit-like flavoprotein
MFKVLIPRAANTKFFLIGLAAVLGPWSLYLLSLRLAAKKLEESKKDSETVDSAATRNGEAIEAIVSSIVPVVEIVDDNESKRKILIIYGTCTGTARKLAGEIAKKFSSALSSDDVVITVVDAKDYDEFVLDQEDIVLFICSTWTGDNYPRPHPSCVSSVNILHFLLFCF